MKSIPGIASGLLAVLFALAFFHKASETKKYRELLDPEREEFRQYKVERAAKEAPRNVASRTASKGMPDASDAEEEEAAIMKDLMERQARGEYFLRCELPFQDRMWNQHAKEAASKIGAELAPKYNALFSELGVSPEQSAFLQNHLIKIRLASFKVSEALQELAGAQNAWKKRAAALMSKEDYAKYTDFEASQPARREIDSIKAMLQRRDKTLDPEVEERMVALVKESGAYRGSSEGPFEEPHISIQGTAPILARLESELLKLQESTRILSQRAAEAGLPETARAALMEYYADRLKQAQDAVGMTRNHLEFEKSQASENP